MRKLYRIFCHPLYAVASKLESLIAHYESGYYRNKNNAERILISEKIYSEAFDGTS